MAFDPMQMMMLMSGVQGFADNLGAAQRGEPVQQSGGMREFVPMMAMMQRGQAQSQELELQRQQLAAAQQAAQREQEMLMKAAPAYAERAGIPVEAAYAAMIGKGGPFADALAKNMEDYTVGDIRFSGLDDSARARAFQKADLGAFDPLSGQTSIDPAVVAAKRLIARDGATRLDVDARNMSNGFDAMLGQAMEDRKAMTAKTDKLNELAAITGEMADIAASNQRVFEPAADFDALMTQGEAILKRAVANEPISSEETQFLSAYNRAKQLNVTEGFNLVANLKPISEAEVKLGLQTALGPGKPVPQVMVRSVQAQLAARRQADLQNEFDRSQAEMLRAAQAGGEPYSPAAHRLHMMEWEKANPVSQDAFQDVLSTLSKKFPYGGGGDRLADDASVDDVAQFYNNKNVK